MKMEEYESVMNGLFAHNTDAAKKAIQFAEYVLSASIDNNPTGADIGYTIRAANLIFMLNNEIVNGNLDIVRHSSE